MRWNNWWMLTVAAVAVFSLANAGLGDEDEGTSKSKSTNNASRSASDESDNSRSRNDRQDEQKGSRSDRDESQEHAALGVALEEYDGHVRVISVMPNSPAAKAGVRVGDEIRAVDDQKIRTTEGLVEEIGEYKPGKQIELSIRRNGERQTLTATLASKEQLSKAGWNRAQQGQYGQQNDQRSFSRRPEGQGDSRDLSEQVRSLQQQVSRLQQQVNELQSNRNQRSYSSNPQDNGNARTGNMGGGQQVNYNSPSNGRMLDRTGQRYSTNRGYSRDHGPRETASGNTADED